MWNSSSTELNVFSIRARKDTGNISSDLASFPSLSLKVTYCEPNRMEGEGGKCIEKVFTWQERSWVSRTKQN